MDDIFDLNRIFFRLFEMICPRWHWSTKWGHHNGFFPHLGRFHSHYPSAISGHVWCGMLTPKCTPKYWLTNGSVLRDLHLHHCSPCPFRGPTTLRVGPSHGSSYHGVECLFMPFITKTSLWPVIVSGGRGLWSKRTTIHIHGREYSRHAWRSQTNFSIRAVCDGGASRSKILHIFGFFTCGGGFIITYWW